MAKKKEDNKGMIFLAVGVGLLLFGGKKSGGVSPGTGTGSNSGQSAGGIKSKYYTITDVQRSQIAIDNNYTEQFGALTTLQKRDINDFIFIVLDPLTEYLGTPLDIESWWRAIRTNQKAGGVPGSYHEKGVAIDFKYVNPQGVVDNKKVIQAIYKLGLPFTELILYVNKTSPKSLHLAFDYKDPVQKEILFKKPDGTYERLSNEFIYTNFLS